MNNAQIVVNNTFFPVNEIWPGITKEHILPIERLTAKEMAKGMPWHPEGYKIHIVPDGTAVLNAIQQRIEQAIDYAIEHPEVKVLQILCQPWSGNNAFIAHSLNRRAGRIREERGCLDNYFTANMDEYMWDDEDTKNPRHVISPRNPLSFAYSLITHLIDKVDPKLVPHGNFMYPTQSNFDRYGEMVMEACNGTPLDAFSGPGWTGHLAFLDPLVVGEDSIEGLMKHLTVRGKLSLVTRAQNALSAAGGYTGDMFKIPPSFICLGYGVFGKTLNIIDINTLCTGGDVVMPEAKYDIDAPGFQRFSTRVCHFIDYRQKVGGVVMPCYFATSFLQSRQDPKLKTDVYISRRVAADVLFGREGY